MRTQFASKLRKLPAARRKRIRSQILIAVALLLLGIGNLVYGNYKYHEYRKLWRQATVQTGLPRHILMLAPSADIGQEAQQIAKLKSRLDFYEVVALGGQCFLVLSLIFVLLAMITVYQPLPE